MKDYSPFDEFIDPSLPKRKSWLRAILIIGISSVAATSIYAIVKTKPLNKKVHDNPIPEAQVTNVVDQQNSTPEDVT